MAEQDGISPQYMVCYKCGRYFRDTNGKPLSEFVIEDPKKRDCYYCAECEAERRLWDART